MNITKSFILSLGYSESEEWVHRVSEEYSEPLHIFLQEGRFPWHIRKNVFMSLPDKGGPLYVEPAEIMQEHILLALLALTSPTCELYNEHEKQHIKEHCKKLLTGFYGESEVRYAASFIYHRESQNWHSLNELERWAENVVNRRLGLDMVINWRVLEEYYCPDPDGLVEYGVRPEYSSNLHYFLTNDSVSLELKLYVFCNLPFFDDEKGKLAEAIAKSLGVAQDEQTGQKKLEAILKWRHNRIQTFICPDMPESNKFIYNTLIQITNGK